MTYSTPPSRAVLAAIDASPSKIYVQKCSGRCSGKLVDAMVNRITEAKKDPKAAEEFAKDKTICKWPHGQDIYPYGKGLQTTRTETKDENLCTSILPHIKSNNKEDLVEAFCRDIDAYSIVFQVNMKHIEYIFEKF